MDGEAHTNVIAAMTFQIHPRHMLRRFSDNLLCSATVISFHYCIDMTKCHARTEQKALPRLNILQIWRWSMYHYTDVNNSNGALVTTDVCCLHHDRAQTTSFLVPTSHNVHTYLTCVTYASHGHKWKQGRVLSDSFVHVRIAGTINKHKMVSTCANKGATKLGALAWNRQLKI